MQTSPKKPSAYADGAVTFCHSTNKEPCTSSENPTGSKAAGSRVSGYILLVGFLVMLILPILRINRIEGKVSETENRYLAAFPQILDAEGNLEAGFNSGFERWLGDNIGFREKFVELAANVKLNIFHQSTGDRVEIGREGWYFYTPDNNIKLASGEFSLSQEALQDIAEKQQKISDYYAAQGTTYILVLTAAKTSIYPEFISSRDVAVRDTICDQVEQYLKEHTNVHVVNTKHLLLDRRDESKLYLKTDTHWTHTGAYTAYQAIEDGMNALGIETTPFSVSFSDRPVTGEFSAMLGVKGILGQELMPYAEWDSKAVQVTDGDLLNQLTVLKSNDADAKKLPIVMYENPLAPNGTLLIYGDSQWMTVRNLPQYLGESFQSVVSTGFRAVNFEVDQAVDPDVVIFGCSERYISSFLTRELSIPIFVDTLPDVPEAPAQTADYWIGHDGICFDTYNGDRINNAKEITIDMDASAANIVGWAADFNALRPLSALYVQVGEQLIRCNYGIERTSVSSHFGNDNLVNTGFSVAIPTSFLRNGEVTELRFIQISADGACRYEPVAMHLIYP